MREKGLQDCGRRSAPSTVPRHPQGSAGPACSPWIMFEKVGRRRPLNSSGPINTPFEGVPITLRPSPTQSVRSRALDPVRPCRGRVVDAFMAWSTVPVLAAQTDAGDLVYVEYDQPLANRPPGGDLLLRTRDRKGSAGRMRLSPNADTSCSNTCGGSISSPWLGRSSPIRRRHTGSMQRHPSRHG